MGARYPLFRLHVMYLFAKTNERCHIMCGRRYIHQYFFVLHISAIRNEHALCTIVFYYYKYIIYYILIYQFYCYVIIIISLNILTYTKLFITINHRHTLNLSTRRIETYPHRNRLGNSRTQGNSQSANSALSRIVYKAFVFLYKLLEVNLTVF